jgi:hypothetical protein
MIVDEHAVEACGCNSIGGLPAPEPLSGEVVTEPTIFAPGTVLRVVGVVL